jgi:hypothetical protein
MTKAYAPDLPDAAWAMKTETPPDWTKTLAWRQWRASGEPWLQWYRIAFVECLTTAELDKSEVAAFLQWREVEPQQGEVT